MRTGQGARTKAAAMIAACLTLAVMSFTRSEARARQTNAHTAGSSRAEIVAFNEKYIAAHLRMDNAAVMSMWAEDGISLLPTTDPIIGKEAIGKFIDEVVGGMPGYHMQKMDVDFQGIEVSGNSASELADEHHWLQPPPGK